ncbi:hypothetical protein AGOR_G00212860 [Albula goreensis]|uniref:Glycosyltransferase 2-like domain-containing protein n=1 Tax=Albula goreensis TaxID=1534307 RepID=A0A8T3CRH0_9TELE|nr:hypothetical protein AGOR_G00212860 [Albula goreensis]
MDLKPVLRKIGTVSRAVFTILFALVVLGVMVWAYVKGFTLSSSRFSIISFGFYGLILAIHVLLQSLFAFVEHRRMQSRREPCSYTKSIGLTISAYQEDPAYLRECLDSVRALQYPPDLLRIIMVVDGNTDEDVYMMEMFREVLQTRTPGSSDGSTTTTRGTRGHRENRRRTTRPGTRRWGWDRRTPRGGRWKS